MRRLENEEEAKFWEAWIKDETIFCYRFGKIGSQGHVKLKKFKTRAEAEAELEAKLAEKLEDGFVEPATAEEEGDDEVERDDESEDEGESDEDESRDDEDESEGDESGNEAESDDGEPADEDEESGDESDDDEGESDESDEDDNEPDDGESEDAEEGDEDESGDGDDAESDEDESGDEDDAESDEDESGDEDDAPAAPRGRNRTAAPVVEEAPTKPTLPSRVKQRVPTAAQVTAAVAALSAVREASVAKARSWKLGRLVKRARTALEQLGGADLSKYDEVASAFATTMAQVIAPKRRLSLEQALSLLWVVDGETYARTVSGWRAKMLNVPVAAEIGLLSTTLSSIPDREVAIHVGNALVRRSSPAAFRHWFARLKPFLTEALATKSGGLAALRAELKAGPNQLLQARIAEVLP